MASQYQNFHNHPPSSTTTTVMATGGPAYIPPTTVYTAPVTFFRANTVKNLGISQTVFGILTVVCGIVGLIDRPSFWFSASGSGLWSGVMIIIAGVLCICAANNPDAYGTKCAALTFCIICVFIAFISGIIAYVGFISMISCTSYCSYDNDYNYNCSYDCYRSTPTMIASACVSIMMTVEFILAIIAAIYTGRGCSGNSGGTVIVQQPGYHGSAGTVITSNATGYQVPYSAPPYNAQQYPQSTAYPQSTGYQPNAYTQAPMPTQAYGAAQTVETYGADYKGYQSAPPPYNPGQ